MSQIDNFLFTKEHEWLSVDRNVATVGITDFAQSELGDIIFIELPQSGEEYNVNDVFGTIEAVKTVADLYMPITGKILEINSNIEDNPESINNSPYKEGWIVKVKISNIKEVNNLLSSSAYKELING